MRETYFNGIELSRHTAFSADAFSASFPCKPSCAPALIHSASLRTLHSAPRFLQLSPLR